MKVLSRRWLSEHPLLWIIMVMVILGIVLTILSPAFFTVGNISNLLKQVSIIALLGAGQTLAILSAGIDLSVGSVLALSAVLIGGLIKLGGMNPAAAALLGILVATACGLVNGFIIAKGKIPPFIVTLGMMGVARGLALVYTKGASFQVLEPFFDYIGSGTIIGVPVPIIIVIFVYFLLYLLLKQTVFGRNVYAIGDNEDASKLAGIDVDTHKIIIYGISGLCAGIAAVIMIGRLASAPPNVAQGAELNAIAATIIGGTSFTGGIGGVETTLIGAMIMSMITNGLNILGVSSFWQQVFIGVIIVLAVWLDKLKIRE
jgi:ribose transport system permease protein